MFPRIRFRHPRTNLPSKMPLLSQRLLLKPQPLHHQHYVPSTSHPHLVPHVLPHFSPTMDSHHLATIAIRAKTLVRRHCRRCPNEHQPPCPLLLAAYPVLPLLSTPMTTKTDGSTPTTNSVFPLAQLPLSSTPPDYLHQTTTSCLHRTPFKSQRSLSKAIMAPRE